MLTCLLLSSCGTAQLLTGHGLVPVCGLVVGEPRSRLLSMRVMFGLFTITVAVIKFVSQIRIVKLRNTLIQQSLFSQYKEVLAEPYSFEIIMARK